MEDYNFYKPYLLEDEYLLWKGKPERGNIITGSEISVMLFGIVWLSFSLFWEMMAWKSTTSPLLIIWGVPFIAIGVYMVFGRIAQKIYLRNKTFYVITNKKIIIKKGNQIQIQDGRDLPPMKIILHKNGCGTILFSTAIRVRRGRTYHTYLALENLADVAQAQNAISQIN